MEVSQKAIDSLKFQRAAMRFGWMIFAVLMIAAALSSLSIAFERNHEAFIYHCEKEYPTKVCNEVWRLTK